MISKYGRKKFPKRHVFWPWPAPLDPPGVFFCHPDFVGLFIMFVWKEGGDLLQSHWSDQNHLWQWNQDATIVA